MEGAGSRNLRFISTVTVAMMTLTGFSIESSFAASTCEDLDDFSLPDAKITLARSYLSGHTVFGLTKAPVDICRIAVTVKPSLDSDIKFEIWIPINGSWNGSFEQIGNGGFAGTIWTSYLANAVSRGYAAAATDDGTSGPPRGAAAFLGHPDIQLDYGYRAIKVTTKQSGMTVQAREGYYPH